MRLCLPIFSFIGMSVGIDSSFWMACFSSCSTSGGVAASTFGMMAGGGFGLGCVVYFDSDGMSSSRLSFVGGRIVSMESYLFVGVHFSV